LNDYLLSLILGIVEGVTEYLPVSSTAHLRLSEALLHVSGLAPNLTLDNGYWKMYSIVIQLGAILCLPVYFWGRIRRFLSTFPGGESGRRTSLTHPLGLTAVAFVVTAIPSFLLTKVIGKHLENIASMGWATDWRDRDVAYRCAERQVGSRRTRRGRQSHTHLEDGGHEPGASGVDRILPDIFGGVSGDIALHVDHRGRADRWDVASGCPRILFLRFHADHGRGYDLHAAQVAQR